MKLCKAICPNVITLGVPVPIIVYAIKLTLIDHPILIIVYPIVRVTRRLQEAPAKISRTKSSVRGAPIVMVPLIDHVILRVKPCIIITKT